MINIASINVQNKYKIKKYDGLDRGVDHVDMLLDIINKYNLDIVGLQEVNIGYYKRLKSKLNSLYHLFGKFRFPDFFLTRILYPFSIINESVPIITCNEIISEKVVILPWIKSFVPRIVTIVDLEVDGVGKVTVMNTHIDYMKPETKIKEIKKILKIIKEIDNPVILMGDFNMTLKNKDFRKFISDLEELNIRRVDISENTFKEHRNNYSIDHVFISDIFNVEEVILEKDQKYDSFSDHYPVIIRLSIND